VSERLDSWKEIAAYLKRDESTVRRWQKEGLPVHRHVHQKKAAVYAYKPELDAWWENGPARLELPEVATEGRRRKLERWTAALTFMALVTAALNFGGLRDRLLGRETARPMTSIAVLPLENLSGDPEQEYFADGMTEALVSHLGRISSLRVISRTSAMHYKGTTKRLPEIANELGVDIVVEGSVLRSGDRVRITAQLIHLNPEQHLWAESYERDLGDVLTLQGDVARAIARQVDAKLTPQEHARLAGVRTVNPEAYEAFLKGRQVFERWPGLSEKAVEYFQEAIDRDPTFAEAHGALAVSMDNQLSEVLPAAKAAAEVALELDPNLPEALVTLGRFKLTVEWDWKGAEEYLRRAAELNPNNSYDHNAYAGFLTFMGRSDEAIAEARRTERLDPANPFVIRMVGFALLNSRRYPEAIGHYQRALQLDPNHYLARWELAQCYALMGQFSVALAEYKKLGDITADPMVGHLYAVSGQPEEARKIAENLVRLSKQRYVTPLFIAIPYAGLGNREMALRFLEQGYENRDRLMFLMNVSPFFDNLRDHPRFQDLLRRMNFPT
jgi:TolB-like protein/Flp pilus assembly protein TadD